MDAVIFIGDGPEEQQLTEGNEYCSARGYDVVCVARGDEGWRQADAMLRDGRAEVLVVASRAYLPLNLEIATVEITGLQPEANRRPRRIR